MLTYILLSICILMFLILIFLSLPSKNKTIQKKSINISPDITNMYLTELDKMILYHTIYNIDVTFGENFTNRKTITGDIENSEILSSVEIIEKDIIKNMGLNMKLYLYEVFGDAWIYKYINIQTLSLVVNYTKININSLTYSLFNK